MTWQLTLHCDHEVFADILGEVADAVSIQPADKTLWMIEAWFEDKPDQTEIVAHLLMAAEILDVPVPEYTLEKHDQTNWLQKTYQDFPPLTAGRFYIYGSHITTPVPAALKGLRIDAATAFGSGEHATTFACLRAISDLGKQKKTKNALDMGCGSGILALALAQQSATGIIGIDNDKPSVDVASFNARQNGLGAFVRFGYGNGFQTPLARQNRPYDLIAANILARPLCHMAPAMKQFLKPGGTIILSGLLQSQENQVLSAYKAQRLFLKRRYRINGWSALVLA